MKPTNVLDLLVQDTTIITDSDVVWYRNIRRLVGPSAAMRYNGYIVKSYSDGRPKHVWGIVLDEKMSMVDNTAHPLIRFGRDVR
jgi:hypothetical protein